MLDYNYFDQYFDRQEEKSDKVVQNIYDFIINQYETKNIDIKNEKKMTRDFVMQNIVSYLVEYDRGITNLELHALMNKIKRFII